MKMENRNRRLQVGQKELENERRERWHQTVSEGHWKEAVALQYDPRIAQAPLLTAKGQGEAAEQMLRLAREHEIPIEEDPALLQLLTKIDVGQQIPPELYDVVAEILALIYQLEKQAQKNG